MTRDDIIERIQPAIDALVDQLVALAPELVRAHLDAVLGQLDHDTPKKSAKEKKHAARTNTCRKCGAIGFTARTCGKTHNVQPGTDTTTTKPATKRDRFARIEAAATARRATGVDARG